MTESSLEVTERTSAARATHPRVRLADIEAAIEHRIDIDGATLTILAKQADGKLGYMVPKPLETLRICLLVMRNGFVVIGKSAPASPENYDAGLGMQYAYEDAVRQLWPLMGFALRDRLHNPEPSGFDRTGKSNVEAP